MSRRSTSASRHSLRLRACRSRMRRLRGLPARSTLRSGAWMSSLCSSRSRSSRRASSPSRARDDERLSDPALLSLTEVAAQIRERKLSSVEVTQALLARIEHWQPKLNAFVRIEAEEALARANEADAELARSGPKGILHGVPLAHKDMYYFAGLPAGCGSKIREGWIPSQTSTVISHLQDAGAIRIGALHMVEFAMGPTGHNAYLGPARNPWNKIG